MLQNVQGDTTQEPPYTQVHRSHVFISQGLYTCICAFVLMWGVAFQDFSKKYVTW
jgi:hypothetical protein